MRKGGEKKEAQHSFGDPGDTERWEVKAALRASQKEGVLRDDGHAGHQLLLLNTPERSVGFACSAPGSSPHPGHSRAGVVLKQRSRDPLNTSRSFPSLTDIKWTHTPGDFSRLCRIWLLLITTCGACRAAGFMGGKLPPVHVSSTHTLALS